MYDCRDASHMSLQILFVSEKMVQTLLKEFAFCNSFSILHYRIIQYANDPPHNLYPGAH